MNQALSYLAMVGLAVCASFGCSYQSFAPQHETVLNIPERYAEPMQDQEQHAIAETCRHLNLPKLPALLAQTSRDNFQLREALARIDAAEAMANQAEAGLGPSLRGSVEASQSDSASAGLSPVPSSGQGSGDVPNQDFPGAGIPVGGTEGDESQTEYQASISASYEVDVWNRLENSYDAARYDAAATRYNRDGLLITLGANVAETWVNLLAQRALLEQFEDQLEISRNYVELTALRFGMGSGQALDLIQQRQQLESVEGELASAQAQLEMFSAQLNSLLGLAPGDLHYPELDQLPDSPELAVKTIPMTVLAQRPDVRAALFQLRAADARTAAAVADRLPSLRLNASAFSFASQASQLFDEVFRNISAGLSAVLFDSGRLAAAVERAESRAEAQLYVYAQTLLDALQETQIALESARYQAEVIASLQAQREDAERALKVARTAYLQGASSYLRVLTALQSLQGLERQHIQAQRQQFSYRIQLCRALGLGPLANLETPQNEQNRATKPSHEENDSHEAR